MSLTTIRRLTRLGMLLILVLGMALVPAPTPAAAGTPYFNIDSWSAEPEDLARGDEFDLTITFTNIGTHGANEVTVNVGSTSAFVGLSPGGRFIHMGIGATNTTTLRVGIDSNLTTGYYSVPIMFSWHDEWGGSQMTATNTIGVHVRGLPPSQPADTGRPQLVIEDAVLAPEGDHLLLTLTLRNTGNRWATNVVVNMEESEVLGSAEGSSAYPIEEDIYVDETTQITIPLILRGSATERVSQSFTLEYSSYSGGSYQSSQTVILALGAAAAQTPHLLIERYTTVPEVIAPGTGFRLNMDIVNVGGGTAERVFVRLGENADQLGPLAPLGSGNVKYLERIAANTRLTLAFDLVVDGDAEAGLVPIDVSFTYADIHGVEASETETISLQVIATPHIQVSLYDDVPDPIVVGDVFKIPVEVFNIGRQAVNINTVEIVSDDLIITDGVLYIGPLDGGTSGSLEATAEATHAGAATIQVHVNYLDTFQQPQVITQFLTFTITESSTPTDEEMEAGEEGPVEMTVGRRLWHGLLGFLGVATEPSGEALITGSGGGGGAVVIETGD